MATVIAVRHLLFDFGGPILRMPYEMRAFTAAKLGVDESDISGGPLDPGDDRWQARVRGEITEREYWAGEAGRFGLDLTGLMARVYEPSGDHVIRDETLPLIVDVHAAGSRAGVLSNDLAKFMGVEWQASITVLGHLDPIIDLSFADYLKPDPRAYADAIVAMDAEPGDIVFVDDLPENVHGGTVAGLVSVWFDMADPAGSYKRIRSALTDGQPQ